MKKLPKLALRDLLWLTLVVALSAGWWMDRDQWAVDRNQLAKWRGRAESLKAQINGFWFIRVEWNGNNAVLHYSTRNGVD